MKDDLKEILAEQKALRDRMETLLSIIYTLHEQENCEISHHTILKEAFAEIISYISSLDINESRKQAETIFKVAQTKNELLDAYRRQCTNKADEIKDLEKEVKKHLSELKKCRKHKYRHGEVQQAYKLFKKIREKDTPSFRQFQNWIAGKNVPDGFPGIDNLTKFAEWCSKWDAPERKKAGRSIRNMSEEEIYKKRKK